MLTQRPARSVAARLASIIANPVIGGIERFGDWFNDKLLAANREVIALEKEMDARSTRVRG